MYSMRLREEEVCGEARQEEVCGEVRREEELAREEELCPQAPPCVEARRR
jgi:hypothetical protein